jgi:hypothetical protein
LPGANAFVRVTHYFAVEVMSRCLLFAKAVPARFKAAAAYFLRLNERDGAEFGAISVGDALLLCAAPI